MTERENRRLNTRLKKARLRLCACLEDIEYRQKRGLDKSLILSLASFQWIAEHLNLLITGPTGVGKSYLPAPWRTKPAWKDTPPSKKGCRPCSMR